MLAGQNGNKTENEWDIDITVTYARWNSLEKDSSSSHLEEEEGQQGG